MKLLEVCASGYQRGTLHSPRMKEFKPPSYLCKTVFIPKTEQDSQYPVLEVILIRFGRAAGFLRSIIHIDSKHHIVRGHNGSVTHNTIAQRLAAKYI